MGVTLVSLSCYMGATSVGVGNTFELERFWNRKEEKKDVASGAIMPLLDIVEGKK